MNYLNSFPEFTMRDIEDAMKYLVDTHQIPYITNMMKTRSSLTVSDMSKIIKLANTKLVEEHFFHHFASYILYHLFLLGECPRFVIFDKDNMNRFVNAAQWYKVKRKENTIYSLPYCDFTRVLLYFPIIKNRELVEAMNRLLKTERTDMIPIQGRPFYAEILPLDSHHYLDSFVSGLYRLL